MCFATSLLTSVTWTFLLTGCDWVEYWVLEHYPWHSREGKWHQNQGSEHPLPLLWDVEEHICLAHRRHGSLQHQLPAFWRAQVLVKERAYVRQSNIRACQVCFDSGECKAVFSRGLIHAPFCRYCVPPEHGKRLERLAKGMCKSHQTIL